MKKPQHSGELPNEVKKLMEQQGVGTDGFLYAVTGDMDNDGGYTTCWLAFDREGLYIACGSEEVVKVK